MDVLAGCAPFVRLVLRRDRLRLALWHGIAVLLAVGIAASIGATYPTEAARAGYAEQINSSPAELFMIGRIDADTVPGLAAWRVQGFIVLLLGIASASTVVRHTRAAEEDGYREFMGSAVVGRLTPLTGSAIVAVGANLVTGAAIAVGCTALGFPPAGSSWMGAQLFAAGAFMTGVAAVTAMLAATSRGATGLAVVVMAACYVVRGTADAARLPGLAWASPYGWLSSVEPYAADDGRPLLPALALTAGLLAAAARLAVRDVGAGLLPGRSGRPRARRGLHGPVSLALRLELGTSAAWSLALLAFGALVATLADSTARQLRDSGALSGLADGPDPALGFIALVVYVFAQVATVFGIQAVLRLRGEETSGRAENVLTAPVSRIRWAAGSVVTALAGTAVNQLAFGLGLGLGYAAMTGDPGGLLLMVAATLVELPAIWVLTAIAVLLHGWAPRVAAPVSYTVLGVLLLLELLVELGHLDGEVLRISPYTQVPQLLTGTPELAPVLVVTALAAALTVGGALGLQRRDLTRT